MPRLLEHFYFSDSFYRFVDQLRWLDESAFVKAKKQRAEREGQTDGGELPFRFFSNFDKLFLDFDLHFASTFLHDKIWLRWLTCVRTYVRPCVSACVQLVSFSDKLLRKIICNNIWLTCSLYWFTSLSVSNRNRYLHAASSYERILPVHDTVQGNVLPPIFLVHLTSNNHCRFQNGEKGRHYLICLNIFLFSRWFG